jgi:predicted outer membrane protein
MYSVEPDGAGPRPWPRRRMWPWWLLIVAAVGIILAVPAWRAALTGNQAGSADPKTTAPAYGADPSHLHDPVQVAATGPQPTGTALPAGWTMTSFGPLGPVDREFLTKVRQAGLWEGPAGNMAQTRAADERVKEVGRQLAIDHKGLDQQVRQVSAQLGVPLPDKPSDEQQGWLNEMGSQTGAQFDDTFANRLRAAHGKVFALVSQIRSGTRNELVRNFAQTGINVVMKHMTLLESIGNVNFGALPEPVAAAATPAKQNSAAPIGPLQPNVVWAVGGVALAIAAFAAFRIFRGSRRSRHRPAF